MRRGSLSRKFMSCPVDVGIDMRVIMRARFHDLSWALGCSGIIKIDQRFAVDCLIKDWEVFADDMRVDA